MGLQEEGEPALKDRRLSSNGCSSSQSQSRGFDKGHRRKCESSRRVRHRRRRSCPPFSSILASHMGNSAYLRQLRLTDDPISLDWLPKASKTMNNVKHLLCGAFSAILSKTTTAPLERVKMEMQIKRSSNAFAVADKILKDGGYKHFWQGNLMNLIRVTPHKAVNFYSFYVYRTALSKFLAAGNLSLGGLDRFFAGALAGSTATVMCYPLDVIRTRMLSGRGDVYINARSTIRTMLKEESISSFYVGCLPAVVSTAASGAIFYGVYDILKTQYMTKEQKRRQERKALSDEVVMGAGRTMLYGALAGAAAESILYPLEVLRRRMQLQGMEATEILHSARAAERKAISSAGAKKASQIQKAAVASLERNYFTKAFNAALEVYKVDGLPGFYNGIAPHILQVLPSAALSYYFYEACKQALKVEEE